MENKDATIVNGIHHVLLLLSKLEEGDGRAKSIVKTKLQEALLWADTIEHPMSADGSRPADGTVSP